MSEKVGFIGLGIMGKPMARNLLKAGYEVTVFDVFPDPVQEVVTDGAKAAASGADVARASNIVITMVQDSPQSEAAILGENGALSGASPGDVIVDMSSIAPLVSQKISEECEAKSVGFLDAPVSGGEPKAIEGTLAIMVGGKADLFERAKALFDVLGGSAVLCGGVGAGNFTKLANQIVVGANIHALAEALVLTSKAGLDPETVFNAIRGGLAGSTVMEAKAPMMFNRNFQAGFRIELHWKDINNVIQTARELQVPLQVSANLQQVLSSLMVGGKGKLDHSAILQFVEEQSGVEVRK